ncbi:hypothetical protein EJB05_56949, partial [Eragrostis curvula]
MGGQVLDHPNLGLRHGRLRHRRRHRGLRHPVTRLQVSAFAALRDAFVRVTPSLTRTSGPGVSLFDTNLSDRTSVDVPAVALRFEDDGTLRLPAKNYLIPVDGIGTYCLAFTPTNAAVSIIGNVQQQGTRVTFDTAKGTVSFAANKC